MGEDLVRPHVVNTKLAFYDAREKLSPQDYLSFLLEMDSLIRQEKVVALHGIPQENKEN